MSDFIMGNVGILFIVGIAIFLYEYIDRKNNKRD